MSAAASHCCACCRAMATATASSSVRARSVSAVLRPLAGLEVVLEVNAGTERAVGLLRLVLHVDLGERQADRLGAAVAAVRVCQRRDDHVVHLDHEELLLALSGLAVRDRCLLQMDAG